MALIRTVLSLAAIVLGAAILAGHGGWLHPALDSFAHLRVQLVSLAGLLVAVLLLARMRRGATILGAIAVGSLSLTLPFLVPDRVEDRDLADGVVTEGGTLSGPYVLLQQNLRYDNQEIDAFLDRVRRVAPDIIALQELRGPGEAILPRLAHAYPYVHRCRGASAAGDVAILSIEPFGGAPGRLCSPGLARVTVRLRGGDLVLTSVHIHWPWPFGQDGHIESLRPHIDPEDFPAETARMVVGDFNAVTWSRAVARVAGMSGTVAARGIGGTRVDPGLPPALRPLWDIPIDQVLHGPNVLVTAIDARSIEGTDHDTVITRFWLDLPEPVPETIASR